MFLADLNKSNMSSLLLLILILSLTTHVCEGRYLSFSSINELNIPAHHQIKVVAMKMKDNKVLEASEMKDDKGKQEMVSGLVSSSVKACSRITHIKHKDQHPGLGPVHIGHNIPNKLSSDFRALSSVIWALSQSLPKDAYEPSRRMSSSTRNPSEAQPRQSRLSKLIGVVRLSVNEIFTPTDLHRWIEDFHAPDPPCKILAKFIGKITRITLEKLYDFEFMWEVEDTILAIDFNQQRRLNLAVLEAI
ncbi:hypothetical protein MA16_Dca017146 [Dendrobium catenatum]|uniref:Uncharacterized protein n=1 Tax=Dendrobium catenatum TaxID=906689 RepID=A0A2I0W2G8_9ASPA|nr:hypothetical protein MA16_Dca017146 [Dendrobium catenatum]